jgi:hypothetical protein
VAATTARTRSQRHRAPVTRRARPTRRRCRSHGRRAQMAVPDRESGTSRRGPAGPIHRVWTWTAGPRAVRVDATQSAHAVRRVSVRRSWCRPLAARMRHWLCRLHLPAAATGQLSQDRHPVRPESAQRQRESPNRSGDRRRCTRTGDRDYRRRRRRPSHPGGASTDRRRQRTGVLDRPAGTNPPTLRQAREPRRERHRRRHRLTPSGAVSSGGVRGPRRR